MKRPYHFPSPAAKTAIFACLFGAALASPKLAHAQARQVDEFGGYYEDGSTRRQQETSRSFALEMRFGPYLPRVDSEFDGGETPFKDYFGKSDRFMLGTEFDWLPLEIPKLLRFGAGIGVSYTTMSAKAHAKSNDLPSAQTTSFRVMPHWLVSVLRFDAIHRNTPIPLVLTAKFGLGNAMWWVNDAPSRNRAEDGTKGRGMSYGVYYGLGAAIDLGVLDPFRAKRMDQFVGINSIYLFGEFYGLELNDFGGSKAMQVGDRSWVLGLAFDI